MSSPKNNIGGEDKILDQTLRPQKWDEYIGQKNIVKTLKLFIDAVNKRGKPSEHILFYGPPGIGKTTLAYIVANELKGEIKVTSGATITKTGDLAAILTNLKDNDVLFIDEIHRLPKPVEEMLYPVMEEYSLDIIIGQGPSARTVRLPVPRITIIGATTKLALLSAPLRDRFGLLLRLDYYHKDEIEKHQRKEVDRFTTNFELMSEFKICRASVSHVLRDYLPKNSIEYRMSKIRSQTLKALYQKQQHHQSICILHQCLA